MIEKGTPDAGRTTRRKKERDLPSILGKARRGEKVNRRKSGCPG